MDTNLIYRDPFLTKGKNALLLQLAKHEDVKLYINDVVYKEMLRGHKAFIEEQLNKMSQAYNMVSRYLITPSIAIDTEKELELMINCVEEFYVKLEAENQLDWVPYDIDLLPLIVELDMNEKPPFIVKSKGSKHARKEIRDAIIWNTYKLFIQKQQLENCFFITNNTKDFGAPDANQSPAEHPYPLHPDLIDDVNIVAYKNTNDFFAHNEEIINTLFKDENLHIKMLYEDFLPHIEIELRNGLLTELITKNFVNSIKVDVEAYFNEISPRDIHPDYFMGGYVTPSLNGDITDINLEDVTIYGDNIVIAANVVVSMDVNIYLYNPDAEGNEDPVPYAATDTMAADLIVVFLLPINTDNRL
ncbi:PIN domain-containing protein, partial [Streptomyces angustmyceticus]|uniref:PIN domain-containing protein n=1 Tax=Streptomyces angustmyceticus TaxID=285578 RepID=UPI00384A81CC